jgi:CheY-like chemotaxis protein
MPAGTRRLLLAEDDPTNQYVLRAILESAGYHVEVVDNGEQALRAARASRPDLIVLDMMMPVMDGYEAATRLSADSRFDAIPILALTAKAMKGDLEKSLESGCDGYMAKPISIKPLLEMVRYWLERPPSEWMPARQAKRAPTRKTA